MMKELIKKLKQLRVIRECAMNFDYSPSSSKVDELLENYLREDITLPREELISLLDEYEGWSPGDINNEIMDVIGEIDVTEAVDFY